MTNQYDIDRSSTYAHFRGSDDVTIETLRRCAAHRRNRGDVVIRADEEERIARAADELAKAVADVE
jgi:hypothetical protein